MKEPLLQVRFGQTSSKADFCPGKLGENLKGPRGFEMDVIAKAGGLRLPRLLPVHLGRPAGFWSAPDPALGDGTSWGCLYSCWGASTLADGSGTHRACSGESQPVSYPPRVLPSVGPSSAWAAPPVHSITAFRSLLGSRGTGLGAGVPLASRRRAGVGLHSEITWSHIPTLSSSQGPSKSTGLQIGWGRGTLDL